MLASYHEDDQFSGLHISSKVEVIDPSNDVVTAIYLSDLNQLVIVVMSVEKRLSPKYHP